LFTISQVAHPPSNSEVDTVATMIVSVTRRDRPVLLLVLLPRLRKRKKKRRSSRKSKLRPSVAWLALVLSLQRQLLALLVELNNKQLEVAHTPQ